MTSGSLKRPPNSPKARLAVMLSGSGRTLMNLLGATQDGRLEAKIALVIASRECLGLERARHAGLEAVLAPGEIPGEELDRILRGHRIDWVVLAGYLRLLNIPPAYRGRVINIHPALLPAHGGPGMYGLRVHEAVLRAGEARTGCTVHFCDEEYDRGEVILTRECEVRPGDTPEELAERVHALECEAYPEALRMVIEQRGRAGGL